jgi:hypothetical protein
LNASNPYIVGRREYKEEDPDWANINNPSPQEVTRLSQGGFWMQQS